MSQFTDISGNIYGKLTVVSFNRRCKDKKGKYKYYWNCVCSCGNTTIVRSDGLRGGTTTSCGCTIIAHRLQFGDQMSKPDGIAGCNNLYCSYVSGARRRGLAFELSRDEFAAIVTKPCTYCGRKEVNVVSVPHYRTKFYYTGIDRVDNTIGYTLENCVPCCKQCNQAKMDLTHDDFVKLICMIYDNYANKHKSSGVS